jgi:hypothetical protein
LDDVGAVDVIRIGLPQHLKKGPPGNAWHEPRNSLGHLSCRRADVHQIAGHPGPLASLPGKNEQARTQVFTATSRFARSFGCLQRREQFVSTICDDREAMWMGTPSARLRGRAVTDICFVQGFQEPAGFTQTGLQRGNAPCRHRPKDRPCDRDH